MAKKINDTYAEINLSTLKKNFDLIKNFAGRKSGLKNEIKVCSIVKANAYGHGMNESGIALAEAGTDYLATADYSESIVLSKNLRKFSKKKIPILCLGLITGSKYFPEIISENLEVSIADLKTARDLDKYARSRNKKINIHIQIDSGIHRTGFLLCDAYEAIDEIFKFRNLNVKGIYSHFATSEIPTDGYARKQLKDFKHFVAEIELNKKKIDLKHIGNTGGILNFSDPFFNMIRPGISLYGYYPDRNRAVEKTGIEPVMTLKSKISFIKELGGGQSISYGRKYFTKTKTKIASIPIGYGDGYSRQLSNKAKVFIKGKLYRVSGTVCMDWIMIDIGLKSNLKVNDEVILFGKEYPAYNLSEIIGTIPYEITCNVSSRVQRVYV